ncbi:amidase family protein [Sandarakinorhabdus rubra]|uniref:amidase family protein n=1 Tax=Sandarakinorhabdus rubra TaxID=2672568 RepID=UPI001EEF20F3|nr:amidase family protein [Sandarakinorhabdus rubra]
MATGLLLAAGLASALEAAPSVPVEVAEASIPDLQAALAAGTLTSRQLVAAYLARINAYDQSGPRLNSLVTLNPAALAEADALDRERATKGPRGPLHGIPVLVKDNYDTQGMPTAGGTLALASLRPARDAEQVARLRASGAIILGKTTMQELAAGTITISSQTNQTRNPYDPQRNPGGSSGGTGAAIAASFAAAGMGSDTCGSIRIPAAYQNLFGIRTTRGLASRAGVMPLSDTQDVAGPLTRSVADLAIMLDATVGEDKADAVTRGASAHVPKSYRDALQPGALKGARIGVVRAMFAMSPDDVEGRPVYEKAIATLKAAGAEVVDIAFPTLDALLADSSAINFEFREDLARYLASHPGAPVGSLQAIVDAGLNHDQLEGRFRDALTTPGRDSQAYKAVLEKRVATRAATDALLLAERLDALLYPSALGRPPLIGAENIASNCRLSAVTGLPALAFPAGFTPRGLPVGLELLGPAFSEPRLLALAYGWEQAAKPRQPPFSTPPLVAGKPPAIAAGTARIAGGRAGAVLSWRYDPLNALLQVTARTMGAGRNAPHALALHRTSDGRPGPVLAQLLGPGERQGKAELILDARARADLAAGRLTARLYTPAQPLGAGETRLGAAP